MRIINKLTAVASFSEINVGECFMYDNCLWLKISNTSHQAKCNAFCFVDNSTTNFTFDWQVIPVDAEITIRNKEAV